jgi:uncharacterized repeat protein (TIGR01451 family)
MSFLVLCAVVLVGGMRPAAAQPALALTKSHVGDFTVGQQGDYTLSVANTGDVATSGTITVVDTLPAGLTYVTASGTGWTCGAAGQSVTCTSATAIAPTAVGAAIDVTVSVTTTTPGSVTNSAMASGGNASNSATANDPTTIDPAPPALAIAKSHAGNFTVGSTGTYTVVASNSGGSATSGTVTVVDTLPAGLTYNVATGTGWTCGSSGQTVTCTSTAAIAAAASANAITLKVNVLAAAVPSVTNSVNATGGGTTSSPTATDPTAVGGAPVLQANKSHTGNFTSGGQGTYSLSVSNIGSTPTTGAITYVDTLPAAFTFVSATGTNWACSDSGQTVTCTMANALANGNTSSAISLVVNVIGAAGSATNSATASGGGAAASSTKTDVTTIVNNAPAAGGTKTHPPGDFIVGQNGTYTITPKNTGVQPTTGTITVTDTLPTGLTFVSGTGTDWTCGASGQLVTCTSPDVIAAGTSGNAILLTVAVGAAAVPTVTNKATITIPGGGSFMATDVATQVDNGARLVASKTHSGNFTDGTVGVWTIGLQNTGSASTSGTITIVDTLQTGLTFLSGVGGNWACSAAGQTVTCTLPDVLATQQFSSTLALTVNVGPMSVGTFINTATPTTGATNFVAGTNSTKVNGVPRLALAKSHSGTFYAGLQSTYTLAVSNTGSAATSGTLTVVDTLPTGLTYGGATGGGWTCGIAGQVVTCTSSLPIAANASGNAIALTVTPQPAAVPSVTNSATFSGGGASASATATDPTTVAIAPVLGISKSHSGNFTAGINGTYTITPINSGFQATSGPYTIVDTLPAGLTYVSAGGSGWSCADSGATVTCTSSTAIGASSIGQQISLVVAVAASAVPSVVNTASSSGGGAPNTGSASDTTTVTIPALGLTKSHTGSFVVGQNGTYTLTAKNNGNATTFGTTTVADTLPAGLAFVSAAGTGWTCGASAGVVTCTSNAAIAAAASFPAITLVVSVPAGTTPGSVTNNATASGGGASGTATATDPTTIVQPQLAIAKSHTGAFPVGGTGAYTIAVSNTGGGATFGTTTVVDILPAGLTYASATGTGWTCSAAAQVVTCTSSTVVAASGAAFPAITLNVTVPAGTLPGPVTNSATASGGGAANSPTATDPTTIAGAPALALAKSHAGSFVAGQTGTYTLGVSNTGNVPTSGTITVTDTLPAGLTFNAAAGTGWTCGGAGQTVTCTSAVAIAVAASGAPISLTVNALAAAVPQVTNNASASGGGTSNTATATDPTTVVEPVLAISKTHTGNFSIGSTGTYAITVSNTGTSATSGTITVIETLPAGLTFSAGSGTGWTCSGAAQSATCTSTASIAAAGAGNPITLVVNVAGTPGSVTNSVSASGGGAANSPTATDPTTLAGTRTLALAKSHTGSFVAGQAGTYTLEVSNTGNVPTSGPITVTDTLPAGLTFNAAAGTGWACSAAGQIVTCTSAAAIAVAANGAPISLTVNALAAAVPQVTNSATASGGGAGTAATATDPTTVTQPVLAIAKTHAGSFTIGTTGTYTIAVSNTGTSATSGTITVTDTLPAGLTFSAATGTGWTCTGAAQSAACTSTTAIAGPGAGNPITLTVNAAGAPRSVTNSVSASGGGASNSPTATDPTTLSGAPTLALAKSHTGSFVAGQTGTYALAVSNTGNVPTSGTTTVTDTLPPGLAFNAATGTGWTCGAAGQIVTCTSSTAIAPSAGGNPIGLTVSVATNAPAALTNSANASGGGASNTATAADPTTVVAPVLAISKTHTGNFAIGTTGTYTVGVGNTGTSPTSGTIAVTDTLPVGLTFSAASGIGWTCSGSAQSATCTSATAIAVGGTGNAITLTVNVAGAPGSVTNSVTATGGGAANSPTATDPTTITGAPTLALAKSHTGSFVAGQTGTYTLVVSNAGNGPTSGKITVTDTLPVGLSFNAATGNGWNCSGSATIATCTSPAAVAAHAAGNPIALTVNVATNAPATLTNSANASGGGAPNAPVATDITAILHSILAIAKTHAGAFLVGSRGTYTIALRNTGTAATSGIVTAIDTLPPGLTFNAASGTGWTCAGSGQSATCTSTTSIAAGGTGSPIAITVNVTGAPGSVTNSATTSGGGAATSATASDPTTITGAPSLALAKSHAGSFVAGQPGVYAIAVSNTGTAATAGTITVTDTLPSGLSFVSAAGIGWVCSGSAQSATCRSSTAIAANAAGNAIALTVNVAANAPATLTNIASVSGGGAANTPGATDATTILHPVLTISKTHAGNFAVGSTGTYTILAGNSGTSSTLGAITLIDTLPPGLTFRAASGNGWGCAASGAVISCTSTTPIPASGKAAPVAISVNVLAAAVPQIVNTATVSGGGATSTPVATDSTLVTGTTVLSGLAGAQIDKFVNSVRSVAAAPGSSVTYSIGFANNGNAAATSVVLSDTFPAGVAPVVSSVTLNGSPSGFSASVSGQTLLVAIPIVPAAAHETIAIQANVTSTAGPAHTSINVASLSANGIAAIQSTPATVFNGSSNIVYDGTRGASAPIGGATIALVDAVSGKAISMSGSRAASAAPPVNPQITAANGSFYFPLGPAQFGAPDGAETYRLTLAARNFRNRSIQAVFAAAPGGLLYSVTLTALDGQALAAAGGFSLVTQPTTIADVLNIISNIPMFPSGALTVQKQADRTTVSTGDRIVYTVSIAASEGFGATRIVDQLPAGLVYAPHSGTLDGAALEPVSSGLTQIWQLRSLEDGTHLLRYDAVVGAGASQNIKLMNVADVTASLTGGGTTSASAQATVQTIAGAFSDRLTVLGRVVIGSADGGWTSVSRGVAGVRLIMEDGTTVVTDAQGRYSLQEVRPGAHVLRLDESSLPAGVAAFGTHAYNDPRSTVRLIHSVMDTRLLQDVIFVVQGQP